MTHCVPCSTPRHPLRAVLWFGLLAGLAAPDAPAAPPAPVVPIITSAATRFTDNSNGTVTDSITGLIWLKNANCFGTQTWTNALSSANGLASPNCGLSDGSTAGQWRLPNRNELQSLIDYTTRIPALPASHPFVDVNSNNYWSSTTDAPAISNAWVVNLYAGYVNPNGKTGASYVWPVRGGQ